MTSTADSTPYTTIPVATDSTPGPSAIQTAAVTPDARSAVSHPLYSTMRSVTTYMFTKGPSAMRKKSAETGT